VRHRIALGSIVAVAALLAAPPGRAASSSSNVDLQISGGSLTISAPASASLPAVSAAPGSVSSVSLGTTTLADTRGTLLGWTVTVMASGNWSDGAGHSISLGAGASTLMWSTGGLTAQGAASLTGVSAGVGGTVTTSAPTAVATALLGFGAGTYTWNGTLTFTVPANVFASTYTVTLVQTAA